MQSQGAPTLKTDSFNTPVDDIFGDQFFSMNTSTVPSADLFAPSSNAFQPKSTASIQIDDLFSNITVNNAINKPSASPIGFSPQKEVSPFDAIGFNAQPVQPNYDAFDAVAQMNSPMQYNQMKKNQYRNQMSRANPDLLRQQQAMAQMSQFMQNSNTQGGFGMF